jgi:hypothetical protein
MCVGVGTVPVVSADDSAIVGHANEHDSAVAVGETHHRVHQLIVGQRSTGFREEFGCELLSTREQPAEFFIGYHGMNLSLGRPQDDSRESNNGPAGGWLLVLVAG